MTRTDGPVTGPDGLARCPWAATHPLNRDYHDTEWGMPVRGERALFERVSLEAFQSGLSWLTILAKREAFRAAFAGFDPDTVAEFTADDEERLVLDAGIVRNRAKIRATIANARAVQRLRDHGGLDELIWRHRPPAGKAPRYAADVPAQNAGSVALSKQLRGRGFVFVGPITCHALMEAIGMMDTHLAGCHRRGSARSSREPSMRVP